MSADAVDVAALASIQLPQSLFSTGAVTNSSAGGGVGLVFTFYETPVLFPLPNGTRADLQIRSAVIGALIGGVPNVSNLSDPIVISLQLNIDQVSWCSVQKSELSYCKHFRKMKRLKMQHV